MNEKQQVEINFQYVVDEYERRVAGLITELALARAELRTANETIRQRELDLLTPDRDDSPEQ